MLIDVAEKKIDHGLSFSAPGMREIEDLHGRLLANLKLAVAVFLNGDLKSAQRLIAEKASFRDLEMAYADNHLRRLGNTPQSVETSSLHLDLLSDFKRVNSLFCSIAYPILETAGVLSPTRLRLPEGGALEGITRAPAVPDEDATPTIADLAALSERADGAPPRTVQAAASAGATADAASSQAH
jgi:phosphate:Na+ symporter